MTVPVGVPGDVEADRGRKGNALPERRGIGGDRNSGVCGGGLAVAAVDRRSGCIALGRGQPEATRRAVIAVVAVLAVLAVGSVGSVRIGVFVLVDGNGRPHRRHPCRRCRHHHPCRRCRCCPRRSDAANSPGTRGHVARYVGLGAKCERSAGHIDAAAQGIAPLAGSHPAAAVAAITTAAAIATVAASAARTARRVRIVIVECGAAVAAATTRAATATIPAAAAIAPLTARRRCHPVRRSRDRHELASGSETVPPLIAMPPP